MNKFVASYSVKQKGSKTHPFVRLVVAPLTIIAVLLVAAGIYSFVGANKIMRNSSAGLDNFPNNILPSFTNASFPSLDGLTTLSGWYFTSSTAPVSTIIMVHGYGSTRLQYGTRTVSLYDFFVN
ncbi:MAG: hypothetical protein ACYC5K_00795, partial [Saccharofermentanales bacterium]